jgi:hypothetical protein
MIVRTFESAATINLIVHEHCCNWLYHSRTSSQSTWLLARSSLCLTFLIIHVNFLMIKLINWSRDIDRLLKWQCHVWTWPWLNILIYCWRSDMQSVWALLCDQTIYCLLKLYHRDQAFWTFLSAVCILSRNLGGWKTK